MKSTFQDLSAQEHVNGSLSRTICRILWKYICLDSSLPGTSRCRALLGKSGPHAWSTSGMNLCYFCHNGACMVVLTPA
eukprot:810019-Karenia_brevis.AAC.1